MNFTKTPPATPGFYAWRVSNSADSFALTIVQNRDCLDELVVQGEWEIKNVPKHGEWCRLVAAEELERAWDEGFTDTHHEIANEAWTDSRAKRVSEGMERKLHLPSGILRNTNIP